MKEAACFTLGYVAGHTAELAQQVCQAALHGWHGCVHAFMIHCSLQGQPANVLAALGSSLGLRGTTEQPA